MTSPTPIAVYLTTDLLFTSKVTGAATALGYSLEVAMSAAKLLERVSPDATRLVVLDLATPNLDLASLVPQIRSVSPAATILAFGPHVQDQMLAAAQTTGCDYVLTRGQFNAELPAILKRFCG